MPIADRCLIRAILAFDSRLRYRVAVCYIGQALPQADVLPLKSRLYAIPPPRTPPESLNWGVAVLPSQPKANDIQDRFLIHRDSPLYGPTDAPLR